MRDIYVAHLDKARPVVVLTRDAVRSAMRRVTVAPITTTVKGCAPAREIVSDSERKSVLISSLVV
jgi:mRNA interferase MazF